jgi:hypothetical protein
MVLESPGPETRIHIGPQPRPPRPSLKPAAALIGLGALAAGTLAWVSIKKRQPDLTARTRMRLAPRNAASIAEDEKVV